MNEWIVAEAGDGDLSVEVPDLLARDFYQRGGGGGGGTRWVPPGTHTKPVSKFSAPGSLGRRLSHSRFVTTRHSRLRHPLWHSHPPVDVSRVG